MHCGYEVQSIMGKEVITGKKIKNFEKRGGVKKGKKERRKKKVERWGANEERRKAERNGSEE